MPAADSTTRAPLLGVVAIGRNEGDRLRGCLDSLAASGAPIVYVDSGSTDGSLELARSKGAEVVELDLSIPFTAARARNAGFGRLLEIAPEVELVQFIDGDCEMVEGWLEGAVAELRGDPRLAVVCGRRRERYPERSVYNRLCDMEWDTPVGDADACGGDALYRVEVFGGVKGFDPSLIAGEEPELCFRIRAAGHRIRRIEAEMTIHDAAMTRFGQWWNRTKRAGHAAAENRWMHGTRDNDRYRRAARSTLFWGGLVPLGGALALIAALVLGFPSLALAVIAALLMVHVAMLVRIYLRQLGEGRRSRDAALYSASCMLGKYPELMGTALYLRNRLRRRQSKLIEY